MAIKVTKDGFYYEDRRIQDRFGIPPFFVSRAKVQACIMRARFEGWRSEVILPTIALRKRCPNMMLKDARDIIEYVLKENDSAGY